MDCDYPMIMIGSLDDYHVWIMILTGWWSESKYIQMMLVLDDHDLDSYWILDLQWSWLGNGSMMENIAKSKIQILQWLDDHEFGNDPWCSIWYLVFRNGGIDTEAEVRSLHSTKRRWTMCRPWCPSCSWRPFAFDPCRYSFNTSNEDGLGHWHQICLTSSLVVW